MQKTSTRKLNIVPGIKNALGFGRRRGGAGAVTAALVVFAVVACLSVSAVGESTIEKAVSNGSQPDYEIQETTDDLEPVPWDKPIVQETPIEYNGATPSRLPC